MKFITGSEGPQHGYDNGLLADLLPWISYDPDTRLYRNQDNSQGYLFECQPLSSCGEQAQRTLEGLFRVGLPDGTIMQVILHADENIEPILENHRKATIGRATELLCRDLKNLGGTPIRNFRLFFAFKFPVHDNGRPGRDLDKSYAAIIELLKTAGLSPVPVPPPVLLDWLRRIFNGAGVVLPEYDNTMPVRKQVAPHSVVEGSQSEVMIGNIVFKSITPKVRPSEENLRKTAQVIGSTLADSDSHQICTPFIHCVSVIFGNPVGNPRYQAWVADKFPGIAGRIEKGDAYIRTMATMVVWSRDEALAQQAIVQARRIWELQGYVMHVDKSLYRILSLVISTLPLGLFNMDNFHYALNRFHLLTPQFVVATLPVQADFQGCGEPVLLSLGRRGQLAGLDILAPGAPNNNVFVASPSPAELRLLTSHIANVYARENAVIRVIDLTDSADVFDVPSAVHVDIGETGCNIALGTHLTPSVESILPLLTAFVSEMVRSNNDGLSDLELSLIAEAVLFALQTENDAILDDIHSYFTYVRLNSVGEDSIKCAARLAERIQQYTSQGRYGSWFQKYIKLVDRDFLVFRAQALLNLPGGSNLTAIVVLQLINNILAEALSGGSERKRIVILFGWDNLLSKTSSVYLSYVIGEAYKILQFRGTLIVAAYSTNLTSWGKLGELVAANSSFRFVDHNLRRPETPNIRSQRGRFAEVLAETHTGKGVIRLLLDSCEVTA